MVKLHFGFNSSQHRIGFTNFVKLVLEKMKIEKRVRNKSGNNVNQSTQLSTQDEKSELPYEIAETEFTDDTESQSEGNLQINSYK